MDHMGLCTPAALHAAAIYIFVNGVCETYQDSNKSKCCK